jgi:phosphomannomutase
MASPLIVSVSGIRGIIGESLTPDIACQFAMALGSYLGGGPVVLARDSRPSGEMLKQAVLAGLTATGCTVHDIGIAPTPTVGIAVRTLQAQGAIQITASHNPAPWNGLKLFGPDGAVLPPSDGEAVRERFDRRDYHLKPWDGIGQLRIPPDVNEEHLRLVCDAISPAMIGGRGLRVFLDGNGGAGGPLGVNLLTQLHCEVVQHNCEASGVFAHEPEPTPAHLVDVAPWVKQTESAVGFVLDPDSDRLALIDEHGQCVSEECTLALAIQYRLHQASGPIVVNMSTSRMAEDLAKQHGCHFARSAVGEANVVATMRDTNALIGGEGNGGVIDPRIGWVRDPFIGMGMILNLMAETRQPLSALVAALPQYAMLKTKLEVSREHLPAALVALKDRWPEVAVNTLDGLRLDGPDWWLHVRGSNTEPVVRIIAESPTTSQTQQLCDQAAEVFQKFR